MDPFEFSARPTRAQVRTSVEFSLRVQYRIYRVGGGVVVFCGLVMLLLGDLPAGILFTLVGLVLAVGLPGLFTWWILRRIGPLVDRPTRYRIDDEGVAMSNDQADHLFRWPSVSRVEQVESLLVGRSGAAWVLAIPTDGLPPATAASMTAFVLSKVPAQRRG